MNSPEPTTTPEPEVHEIFGFRGMRNLQARYIAIRPGTMPGDGNPYGRAYTKRGAVRDLYHREAEARREVEA